MPKKKISKSQKKTRSLSLKRILQKKYSLIAITGVLILLFGVSAYNIQKGVTQSKEENEITVVSSPTPSPKSSQEFPTATISPKIQITLAQSAPSNPTNTPTSPPPTPTPTSTTGSISGGYYDSGKYYSESNKDNALITTDAIRSAVLNDMDFASKNTIDKPKWSFTNLQPGRYKIWVDFSYSRLWLDNFGCTNCTPLNKSPNSFEVEIKAGESIQTFWTFSNK